MLALGFRIHGGLVAAFGGCYALLGPMWFSMMRSLPKSKPQELPPTQFFGVMAVFLGGFVALTLTLAVLSFLAASRVDARRGHTFVVVVACLSLLMQPLGTVLGILALILLSRPSVKALFSGA